MPPVALASQGTSTQRGREREEETVRGKERESASRRAFCIGAVRD